MISLSVNGTRYDVSLPPDTPLLWVIRETLKLTGTKYGCGNSTCGACTVLVEGNPRRSCAITLQEAEGKEITTIEGVPDDHPVKRAWIEERVARCGYCQPGQIMSAIGLLAANPDPDDFAIDVTMSGTICRCGTYSRIRRAVKRAAEMMRKG
ncbi:MAG: (2Fe-2S)-binding protein [Desulfuromonadia bacterium]